MLNFSLILCFSFDCSKRIDWLSLFMAIPLLMGNIHKLKWKTAMVWHYTFYQLACSRTHCRWNILMTSWHCSYQFYWKRTSTFLSLLWSHSIAIYHRLHSRARTHARAQTVFRFSRRWIKENVRTKQTFHFHSDLLFVRWKIRYAVNGHDDRIHSILAELLLLQPLDWRQILYLILFAHFIYAHFNFNQNIIAVEQRERKGQKLKIGALHRHTSVVLYPS